jgi:hypothetical protein
LLHGSAFTDTVESGYNPDPDMNFDTFRACHLKEIVKNKANIDRYIFL